MPPEQASVTVPLSNRDPSDGIPGSRQDKTHDKNSLSFANAVKSGSLPALFYAKKWAFFQG